MFRTPLEFGRFVLRFVFLPHFRVLQPRYIQIVQDAIIYLVNVKYFNLKFTI